MHHDADSSPGIHQPARAAAPRRETGPIWALSCLLAIVGVAITLGVRAAQPALVDHPLPLVLVFAMFLAVEVLRIDIAFGRHSHSFTMSELALAVALMTARPADVVLGQTLAMLLFFGLYRRVAPIRLLFNVGQVLASLAVATWIFAAIAGPDAEITHVRAAMAAIVAAVAVAVMQALAVSLVIRLSGRRIERVELLRNLAFAAATSVASAAIGVQAVSLARRSMFLVPFLALPLVLAFVAYRGYLSLQRLSQRTEFLREATNALHETPNLDEGLLALLRQTRSALRATEARMILFTSDGVVTVAAREEPAESVPMSMASDSDAVAAWTVLSRLTGPTALDPETPGTGQALASLGIRNGIAVPVSRRNERSGLLFVANRLGNLDAFEEGDLDLVSLVGNQVSVALERGWLQQSLRQLLELESRLAHQAFHDGLTGLANRRLFNDRIEELFAGEQPVPAALLIVDLDDFKVFNDSYGHVVGDELLIELGARLNAHAYAEDMVARLGGDEFALVLSGVSDVAVAEARAREILAATAAPVITQERELVMSVSVGVALTGSWASGQEQLLRNADLALYRAKQEGKNRVAAYHPSMDDEAEARRRLIAALSLAVPNSELNVVFQPIHDLVSGELLGAEALMRWMHPTNGPIPPSAFLTVAEQTGLIAPMGAWMLQRSLGSLARWVSYLGPDRNFSLNVNLSARQLLDVGLVDVVRSALTRSGVEPSRLVLEITESALIEDIDRTREVVFGLAGLGVKVALDDFGTGYSSFTHVRTFPLHQIKIDASFVASIDTNPTNAALVGSIVHLANALGLTAVAEGIENPRQLAELRRCGCRVGQGFLMSVPLSEAEFDRRIRGEIVAAANWLPR